MLLDRARAGLPRGNDLEARRLTAISSYVSTIIARYAGDAAGVLSALDAAGPNVPGPDDSGFDRSDLDLRAAWRSTRGGEPDVGRPTRRALAEARLACSTSRGSGRLADGGRTRRPGLAQRARRPSRGRRGDRGAQHLADPGDPSASPYVGLADLAGAWVAMERGQLDRAAAVAHASRKSLARRQLQCSRGDRPHPAGAPDVARRRSLGGDRHAGYRVRAVRRSYGRGLLRRLEAWVRVEILLSRGDVPDAVEAARGGSEALQAYAHARAGWAPLADITYDDGDLGLQLRTLLTHAIALHQSGRREGADQCLDAALDLTAAEGYRLPYLQLGARAHALLINGRVAAARHGQPGRGAAGHDRAARRTRGRAHRPALAPRTRGPPTPGRRDGH